jgi:hypothetical protein
MYVCKIDGTEYKTARGLANRLRVYDITSKAYYDKYLKKDLEGVCLYCKVNQTKFTNLTLGYKTYCSSKCCCQSEEHRLAVSNRFVNNPNVLESFRQKSKESYNSESAKQRIQKALKTKEEKYGSEYFSNVVKDVWSKRSIAEKLAIAEKSMLTKSKRNWYKPYQWNDKTYPVQGYEPFVLDFLTENGFTDFVIGAKNVPKFRYQINEKEQTYYPDIFLPSLNLIVEVKSKFTFDEHSQRNEIKKESVLKAGYNFTFVIFHRVYSDAIRKDVLDGFKKYLDWLISSRAAVLVEGSTTTGIIPVGA